MTKEKNRPETYNNGGMIIGKEFLTKAIRDDLIRYQMPEDNKYFGTDQALLCNYFKGRITDAPQRFNTLVTVSGHINIEDLINYHYIIKPNTHNFIDRVGRDLFDLWQYYQGLNIDLIAKI